MPTTLETLQAEVLRLPQQDRSKLLDQLITSLDTDAEAEAAWDVVADEREQELHVGGTQAVDLASTMARLEAKFPG